MNALEKLPSAELALSHIHEIKIHMQSKRNKSDEVKKGIAGTEVVKEKTGQMSFKNYFFRVKQEEPFNINKEFSFGVFNISASTINT